MGLNKEGEYHQLKVSTITILVKVCKMYTIYIPFPKTKEISSMALFLLSSKKEI